MPTKKREPANVEEKEMLYLGKEGGDLVFVDRSNNVGDTIKIDTRTHEYVERVERLHN